MRKRSAYKPRPQLADPLGWVLSGLQPMRENEHAVTLRIKNHSAMLDLTQGVAGRDQVDVLIAAVNMAEALRVINPQKLGEEYESEINAAQDALYDMSIRGLRHGKFLLTGEEMKAINLAMEIHDAQLDACNIAELDKAVKMVKQVIIARRARVIA